MGRGETQFEVQGHVRVKRKKVINVQKEITGLVFGSHTQNTRIYPWVLHTVRLYTEDTVILFID